MTDMLAEQNRPAETPTTLTGERNDLPADRRASHRACGAVLMTGVSGIGGFVHLMLAAPLAAFIANGFAFSLSTVRLTVVLLLTILFVNGTIGLVKSLIARHRSVKARLVVRPLHLLLLVLVALFTQLIGTGAAIVFGLLLVVDHAADPSPRDRRVGAAAVICGTATALLVGIAAVVGNSIVAARPFFDVVSWVEIDARRAPELAAVVDLATVIALEGSAALVLVAVGSLPVLLLPLRGFEGRLVWEWSPVAWFISYAFVAVAAGILVAPMVDAVNPLLLGIPFVVYAVTIVTAGAGRARERASAENDQQGPA